MNLNFLQMYNETHVIYLNIWDCTVSSYLSCLTPLTSDQKKLLPSLRQQLALLHFLPSGHVETCFCGSGTSSCAKGPSEDTRDNKCMRDGVTPQGRKSWGQGVTVRCWKWWESFTLITKTGLMVSQAFYSFWVLLSAVSLGNISFLVSWFGLLIVVCMRQFAFLWVSSKLWAWRFSSIFFSSGLSPWT